MASGSIDSGSTYPETYSDGLQLLIQAAFLALSDKGFDLPTERAQKARLCAEKFLDWAKTHQAEAGSFATTLLQSLRLCCTHPRKVTYHTLKERMWEKYYKLCATEGFRGQWATLINNIGFQPTPIFYQYVTDVVMEIVIKEIFPVDSEVQCTSTVESLDFEEINALRYTAGYILHSLSKKVKKSATLYKHDLLLCLEEISEGILYML